MIGHFAVSTIFLPQLSYLVYPIPSHSFSIIEMHLKLLTFALTNTAWKSKQKFIKAVKKKRKSIDNVVNILAERYQAHTMVEILKKINVLNIIFSVSAI